MNSDYFNFMTVSTGAAAALIGLLFVSISFRFNEIFGVNGSSNSKRLASASFTGLANAFALSLFAIIPKSSMGIAVILMSLFAIRNSALQLKEISAHKARVAIPILVFYLAEFVVGVGLLFQSSKSHLYTVLCYLIFTSFIISLSRSWTLLRGEEN